MSKATSKLIAEIKSVLPRRPLTRSEIIDVEDLLKRLVEEHGIRRSRQ